MATSHLVYVQVVVDEKVVRAGEYYPQKRKGKYGLRAAVNGSVSVRASHSSV